MTLHQGGTSSTTVVPNLHCGSDGGIGLHQVIRNSNIVVGLPESGPSIDLHHSVIGGSSDVIVRLHEDGSSRGIGSTQSDVPLGSSSPPLNTPVASPPSISNLLELSLPATVGDLALPSDSETGLLDVPIQDSSATAHPSFVGKSSTLHMSIIL